jgi:hypothetical protein
MYLPTQSQPVQRTAAARHSPQQAAGPTGGERGVATGEHGVQPCALQDIVRIGSGAAEPILRIFAT